MTEQVLAANGPRAGKTVFLSGVALTVLVLSVSRADAGTCPAYGGDTDCGTIITITASGATVVNTGQPPYDGSDDTLVGVVNNSSVPLTSLILSSGQDIFGFDGDGVDTFGAPGNSQDTTGYGGPNVYFTNYTTTYSGTVNFVTPVAPGQTTYFSLENALGNAYACTSLINKAVTVTASGTNINASFAPNFGYSLQSAAQLCGFVNFDWIQTVTKAYDPMPFFARNLNGAFDAAVSGAVRITSKMTPFNDPPQGGGYTYTTVPDYSYPFYYDPSVDLPANEPNGITGTVLNFHDAPQDWCFQGGPWVNTAMCNNSAAPAGAAVYFVTHLAGVNSDGSAQDLGIGFTWSSNYNGASNGGISTPSFKTTAIGPTNVKAVGVENVNEISYFHPIGVSVTGINGGGVLAGSHTMPLTGLQASVQALGPLLVVGPKTKNGLLVTRNISGAVITGPIEVVLTALAPGVRLANANGTMGGFPYVTISAKQLNAGAEIVTNLQFLTPTGQTVSFNPIVYSGSL